MINKKLTKKEGIQWTIKEIYWPQRKKLLLDILTQIHGYIDPMIHGYMDTWDCRIAAAGFLGVPGRTQRLDT